MFFRFKVLSQISAILFLAACSSSPSRQPAAAAFFEESFMAPIGKFPSVHSASMAEIPEQNRVLGCWYAGSREMGPDVQIYCSTTSRNSSSWSDPTVAVRAGERHTGDFLKSKSIGNPVLIYDGPTQKMYLFFGVVTIGGWAGVHTFYKISADGGKTWSSSTPVEGDIPGHLTPLGATGKFVRTKPLFLSQDEFLLPMYSEWDSKRSFTCSFRRQQDGLFKEKECLVMPGTGSLQPSLVFLDPTVHAFTRSKSGHVKYSRMDLSDRRWRPLEDLALMNPDSSIDTVLSDDKKVLLVGNIMATGRSEMTLEMSQDFQNFQTVYSLENSSRNGDQGTQFEYSYPAMMRTSDGIYHLAYTYLRQGIKYVRFNEAWLQEQAARKRNP